MRIKTIVLFCALALASTALAQQASAPAGKEGSEGHGRAGHHMMTADEQMQELTQKLNLTSDQQAKVKPIVEDTHQQMEAIMKDDSLSREDKMTKVRTLHESAHAKLRDILTDEQKKKLSAMEEEMRGHPHAQGEKKGDSSNPK
jgi:periplasmic protein CpxP/Spy